MILLKHAILRTTITTVLFLTLVTGCDRSSPAPTPTTTATGANDSPAPSAGPSESNSTRTEPPPSPAPTPEPPKPGADASVPDSALTLPDLTKVPAHTRRLIEKTLADLEAAPGSADLPARLGMIYLTNDLEQASIPLFRRATEKMPRQPANWYYLGMALAAQKDEAGAIAAFRKSVELEPTAVYTRLRLGKLLLTSDKPAALKEYVALAALDIPVADTLVHLATAFDTLDKPDAALAAARKAVELEPECPLAHAVLADLLDKQEKKAEAAEHRALARSPGRCKPAPDLLYYTARAAGHPSEAGISRALALAERGSFDLATDALNALSRSDAMNLDVQVALAQVYQAQGAIDRALDVYKQVLMSEPAHASAATQCARTLVYLERYAEAEKVLGPALAAHADSTDLLELQGRVLANTNRVPEATTVFRRWIELKQGDPRASLEFARVLIGVRQFDAALLEIEPLVKVPKAAQEALAARATIKDLKGDAQGAEEDLRAAIAVDPMRPEPHMTLGIMLAGKKRYDQAIEALREGNKNHPTDPAIQNGLAWLLSTVPQANLRDGKKALELARACCTSTHFSMHGYLDTLGTAYAEVGQFDAAAAAQRKAIDLARRALQKQSVTEYESRLALYSIGRPYRMPE